MTNSINSTTIMPQNICAVDLDNLLVDEGGFAKIDIALFCARVRAEAGSDCVIRVFCNGMKQSVEAVWRRYGAIVERTITNADEKIAAFLTARRDARRVIIVSGDFCFASSARFHRSLNHHVQVWSRRARTSHELAFAADVVDFSVDQLLTAPRPSLPATTFA
ncbi:hypothetical protein [Parasphingorhabdus sp.]|uniref:hypothetical protein n=1 Tax=Parasphingorhabdus sp. TaxID=2709688 RepID=UPI002B269488|nr:hypothetical protein [Parasphingorhabdus sp.]